MPVLLGVTKFGIPKRHPLCGKDCNAVFLPGGVESARMVGPRLNSSLLEGGGILKAEAIRIRDANGFHLTYHRLGSNFTFDMDNDCRVYGQQYDDAIQICVRDVNQSIAVGM
jgi:hypothetical protein